MPVELLEQELGREELDERQGEDAPDGGILEERGDEDVRVDDESRGSRQEISPGRSDGRPGSAGGGPP